MIFNQVNFNFHCDIKPKLAIVSYFWKSFVLQY